MMLISILCLDMQCQFCWHILPELFCRMWNRPLGQWYSELSLNSAEETLQRDSNPPYSALDEFYQALFHKGRWRNREAPLYFIVADATSFLSLGKRVGGDKEAEKANSPRFIPWESNQVHEGERGYKCYYRNSLANTLPTQRFLRSISKVVGRRRWFRVQPPALGRMGSRVVERVWPYKSVPALHTQPPHSQALFRNSLLCSSAELLTEKRSQMPRQSQINCFS